MSAEWWQYLSQRESACSPKSMHLTCWRLSRELVTHAASKTLTRQGKGLITRQCPDYFIDGVILLSRKQGDKWIGNICMVKDRIKVKWQLQPQTSGCNAFLNIHSSDICMAPNWEKVSSKELLESTASAGGVVGFNRGSLWLKLWPWQHNNYFAEI